MTVAKEEEMSHLYLPWGSGERYSNRLQVRNQFASTLELHKATSHEYQEPIQRQRSPSLPPIHHIDAENRIIKEDKRTSVLNRNIPSAKRFSFYDEDGEGDTSGYGSETVNNIIMKKGGGNQDLYRNPVIAWQQNEKDTRTNATDTPWSARSSRTAEEGRPRWGDRGIATGRLWEPTTPNDRLPQVPNQNKGTPSWVERGLNMIDNTAEVLVIDQRSSSNSTGIDCERLSCNGSDEGRTFLRGQNVPLEPEIKAQRENKRIKALELQSAILSQLEDREKRRQEEREIKLKEERLEELRIQRQQEEDRIKLEEEKRKNEEKRILEQKKLEALKKALDDAEKLAKLDKEKRFNFLKKNINNTTTTGTNEVNPIINEINNKVSETSTASVTDVSPNKTNRTCNMQSAKSQTKEGNSHNSTEFNSPRSVGPGNLNLFIHSVPPLALTDHQYSVVPISINNNSELLNSQSNSIQLAVLVPQNFANSLYSVSLNSLNNKTETDTNIKVITPRKYRNEKTKDASTQTELNCYRTANDKIVETDDFERNIDNDYSNIDENAPKEITKKDRRFRSEERYKKDIENRPKWGVNRPAAQYKKQSEKDPFYSQKRKVRQKYRPQPRQYLSQSSEDSRSPSPPTRSDKNSDNNRKHRNSISQSYWKNKGSSQDNSKCNALNSNISICNYQLQPEYCSLSQITTSEFTENKKSPKMSPTKRITLSQKFINDKYGNRKLWMDDLNEKNTKMNHLIDMENRKKIMDQINNITKRELIERNESQESFVIQTQL